VLFALVALFLTAERRRKNEDTWCSAYAPDRPCFDVRCSAVVFAAQTEVEYVVVVYATPPTDDSMTNPDYALSNYHWHSTIN
jgi:hypothetical protein